MEKRYWFKAKRYGYGWVPATWEGWAVIAAYMLLETVGIVPFVLWYAGSLMAVGMLAAYILLLTCGLVWICMRTGEKARWRWGN
jgi:hypothetical protein